MGKFRLSEKSLHKLEGIHEDLAKVVKRAIELTQVDFGISQGLRTIDYQRALYAQGRTKPGKIVTWSMNSRHLTGKAVDFIVYVNGKYIDGNTEDEIRLYHQVADAFLQAGVELNVPIVWGGSFRDKNGNPRPDSGHIELNKNFYP